MQLGGATDLAFVVKQNKSTIPNVAHQGIDEFAFHVAGSSSGRIRPRSDKAYRFRLARQRNYFCHS